MVCLEKAHTSKNNFNNFKIKIAFQRFSVSVGGKTFHILPL